MQNGSTVVAKCGKSPLYLVSDKGAKRISCGFLTRQKPLRNNDFGEKAMNPFQESEWIGTATANHTPVTRMRVPDHRADQE
jgi:hypothetical protein